MRLALRSRIAGYFMLLLAGLALFSCKSRRVTAHVPIRAGLETLPADTLAALLAEVSFPFRYLTLSGEGNYIDDSGNKNRFQFRLQALRDSFIWCSAGRMGVEGFRALVRPDSLFLIDRMGQSLKYAAAADLPATFATTTSLRGLQAALIGRLPERLSDETIICEAQPAGYIFNRQGASYTASGKTDAALRLQQTRVVTGDATLEAYFSYKRNNKTAGLPSLCRYILSGQTNATVELSYFRVDTTYQLARPAFNPPARFVRKPLLMR